MEMDEIEVVGSGGGERGGRRVIELTTFGSESREIDECESAPMQKSNRRRRRR